MALVSSLAARLPDRVLVTALNGVYTRFEPELRHLDEMCPRGGTALDIGAWYGPWSARLARRADRVVAFEPTPHTASVLRSGAPANVEVIVAAVSDQTGEAQIWVPDGSGPDGMNSLTRQDQHARSVTVQTVTIDSLELTGVTFAKIDVEGHEVQALHGAEQTIKRDRPRLFIEVEARMQPIEGVVDLLAGWGYRGWVLPENAWVPLDDFDLAAHQALTQHVASHGLLKRVVWPRPRYVNSVLFMPDDQTPAASR